MSGVAWPPTLVERVAANQWVLFIGSGVSASCTSASGHQPPTWQGLLTELADLIASDEDQAVAKKLIANREFLPAADHIRYALDAESNLSGYWKTIRQAVDGPTGNRFEPSRLFQALLDLEPKVVFTTNYDKLFEVASKSGFAAHSYTSEDLGHDIRLGEPVLVKLHGSTDQIKDIVLTRTDYAQLMRRGREVYETLRALSLTSTILFVGYSLDDPDVQLVLQAVGRTGMSPEAHFMLAAEPESGARIPVFKESYGVSVLTYPAGQHEKAEEALRELGDLALGLRAGPLAP
ncbi:SIR2 family NAD-dependent protein deacylase [Conexibacter woesei]|uniref:Uncharacterized protein n=1 Tax=Conexibacter woesei (strain DSM 14684 / CCUG 47730 / CIP 108061 / JCM 11494 / NBRC 100937 / ID131577) TaxID=469383 RepID=D3F474_CONWI|nr:SIR2 family protein [Conexibacter woesei]ADB50446.1 hypothetical protein Cwoe_2020 [Conexibacter woesei DSM 14684]